MRLSPTRAAGRQALLSLRDIGAGEESGPGSPHYVFGTGLCVLHDYLNVYDFQPYYKRDLFFIFFLETRKCLIKQKEKMKITHHSVFQS